jgi:hypothetical protein
MKRKTAVALICCLLLFTTAAVAQGPVRDLLNRLFGSGGVRVTSVENVLANPDKYANDTANAEITVEGTLGPRAGYGWMRGDIYGVYDEKGNVIDMQIWVDSDKIDEQTSTYEEYRELNNKWRERIESLMGKKVRVTGVVDTSFMKEPHNEAPLIVVTYTGNMDEFGSKVRVV